MIGYDCHRFVLNLNQVHDPVTRRHELGGERPAHRLSVSVKIGNTGRSIAKGNEVSDRARQHKGT